MPLKDPLAPEVLLAPLCADSSGLFIADSTVSAGDFYMGRLHCHYFYEMELFLSGDGEYEVNNRRYPLEPGALFLVTPADFHRCLPGNSPTLHYYNLQFPVQALSEEAGSALYARSEPLALTLSPEEYDFFTRRLSHMRRIYEEKGDWYAPLLHREIESLCLHLLRRVGRDEPENAARDIQSALIYIKQHYREPLTLTEVARHAALSPCYFSDRFAAAMGMGFADYVRLLRLNAAANLLASTALPVSQIAYFTGFRSPAYFSDCFKARFGRSPRAYRSDLSA